MTISRSCQFLVIFVVTFCLCIQETKNNDKEDLSGDFQNFVKDMESKVFKENFNAKNDSKKTVQYATTSPNIYKKSNFLDSQKAAFRDVLMMKLVSYYEDKYKLSFHETSPSPSIVKVYKRPKIQHIMSDNVKSEDILNDIQDRASAEVVVI
ncbi:uncharacterized protein LOC106131200 [Amyelois transitella]|uniref:uncharacterized protein LOC106131200 n=1 Tax=Amyelois transitella TaxID=680683 RepID=UPI0029900514|nr:uncharacterized protein LOC106131200 [Amyelois transitella]